MRLMQIRLCLTQCCGLGFPVLTDSLTNRSLGAGERFTNFTHHPGQRPGIKIIPNTLGERRGSHNCLVNSKGDSNAKPITARTGGLHKRIEKDPSEPTMSCLDHAATQKRNTENNNTTTRNNNTKNESTESREPTRVCSV